MQKRGGKRAGAGRPPVSGEARSEVIQVRMSTKEKESFRQCGGAAWLRTEIARHGNPDPEHARMHFDVDTDNVKVLGPVHLQAIHLAQFTSPIQCGFPSTTFEYDYATPKFDLSKNLIRNPSSTFVVQTRGDSMIDCGITAGDTLIVDRGLTPKNGDIVLAAINGEFTVKRFRTTRGKVELLAENTSGAYPILSPGEYDDFSIAGVVTHCIKQMR